LRGPSFTSVETADVSAPPLKSPIITKKFKTENGG
jgi:hypothetical protein